MKQIVFLAFLLITNKSFANDLSAEFDKCMKSAVTNRDFGACTQNEIKHQEKKLSKAWVNISAEIKEVSVKAYKELLNEQRLWIKYKDSACNYFLVEEDKMYVFGHEGTSLHFGICKASVIAERVDYLKNTLPR